MTTRTTIERDLTAILEDLYLGPTPNYRDEALAAVRHTRQRPAWAFAGRWLPMADIASRPALVPRVPWRAIGLALLVIALLVATAFVVGSRQTRVPPPFGLADNGLIAYARDGDIFTVDPVTGVSVAVVAGPENDFDPVFSPDGTRIQFRRSGSDADGSPTEDLVVVMADGSNPVLVSDRLDGAVGYVDWAPDSRSLVAESDDGSAIWRLDATTAGEPDRIASDALLFLRPFRPPHGTQLLIHRVTAGVPSIVLLDLESGAERPLVTGTSGLDLDMARWSPTGDRVVYVNQPSTNPSIHRLEIVDVDGAGEPVLVPGLDHDTFDSDPAWSQDGSKIAFIRWEHVRADEWDVRPITVYSVADGTVSEVGPRPREVRAAYPSRTAASPSPGEAYFLEFSPDATRLLAVPSEASGHPVIVDLATNEWEVLEAVVLPSLAANLWQRNAIGP